MAWVKYKGNQAEKQQRQKYKPSCVEVTSRTVAESTNIPVDRTSLRTGAVAKVPVVLAEFTIQINVDSVITLPEPALEIKNIKKSVKVSQCLLLQDMNTLFIKGFVRKNMKFVKYKYSNNKNLCGDIRHCSIDVPFSATTPVHFNGMDPVPPKPNEVKNFEYARKQDLSGGGFGSKDQLLYDEFGEFNQVSTEYFNELPFCELVKAKVVAFDGILNPMCASEEKMIFEERGFRKIEEKMAIFLTIKIFQKREISIGAVHPTCHCYNDKE